MKAFYQSCAVIAVVVIAGCSKPAAPPQAEPLTDAMLQQQVKTRLQSDGNVSGLNLNVSADAEHNAVSLEGLAYTQLQRTRAVELAKGAHEGVSVQDKIEVKPYEIPRDLFNDEMMSEVKADASRMGDEMGDTLDDGWVHMKVVAKLIADSQTPERSINVDVKDSVVTLRGNVKDRAAREQAETVAKSVEGVKAVRNRLVLKP